MLIKYLFSYTKPACFLALVFTVSQLQATAETYQNPVNFSAIMEYAEFSNAAYHTKSRVRELSQLKNHKLTYYSNIPEIHVSYFLATNDIDKTQIISVRGTSNVENAIVDIALKLIQDKHAGVRIHKGFSLAAQQIYEEIQPHLKKDYVINTTGHSMGGAVALILAMYLDVDNYDIGQVITFGQPKVTNIAGANKFQHLNIVRIVTQKDLVPLVPPFDPLDLNNIDIYWHQGKEVILLPDTSYAVLEGISSMMRVTKFTQEMLSEKNITNHQMTEYIALVGSKIPDARLVPFQNSLNLFNLFGGGER